MITKIKHFSLKLVEDAEGNLWPDDFDNSPLTNIENIAWTEVADQAAAAAFESAGRNIGTAGRNIWLELASTEVADQAAAAGSAALPVTIPRPTSPETEPPRFAELLVSSCTKNRYRKALLNDLDEDFQRDLSKGMTVGRARMRYRGSALRSITPQLWELAKRIGIFGLIADYARRLWWCPCRKLNPNILMV
jgi:hypothetical protein